MITTRQGVPGKPCGIALFMALLPVNEPEATWFKAVSLFNGKLILRNHEFLGGAGTNSVYPALPKVSGVYLIATTVSI